MKSKLLNLGCGSRIHEDWVNVDFTVCREGVIAHDLTKGIPFSDGTFDAVYHSHILEHFPKQNAAPFISECFRVLKPGGILRIVIPDLESLARGYVAALDGALRGDSGSEANYDWIMTELFDQVVRTTAGGEMAEILASPSLQNEEFIEQRIGTDIRDTIRENINKKRSSLRLTKDVVFKMRDIALRPLLGKHYDAYKVGRFRLGGEVHQWMYDRYSLPRLLKKCGFKDPKIMTALTSEIPDFNKYGFDLYKGKPRGIGSLFVEATKP